MALELRNVKTVRNALGMNLQYPSS